MPDNEKLSFECEKLFANNAASNQLQSSAIDGALRQDKLLNNKDGLIRIASRADGKDSKPGHARLNNDAKDPGQ